ncbi:MAG: ExbD/TolR family protein [bacterium]
MSRLGKQRSKGIEEIDIDMVPIMNMFLVLIPFLLMSAAFFHLRAINTSVPVLAEGKEGAIGKAEEKVTVIVEIKEDALHLSTISDSVNDIALSKLETRIVKEKEDEYPLDKMVLCLRKIKESYPASDTLILIPDGIVLYETIIQTMDVARQTEEGPLFPNVVISGKV